MTMEPSSSAIWSARPRSFSMSTTSWPELDQLLGQVVADLAAADDEHEHRLRPPGRCRRLAPATAGARAPERRRSADPDAPGGVPARSRADRVRMLVVRALGAMTPGRRSAGRPRYALTASIIRFVRQSVAMPARRRPRRGPGR